MKQEIDAEWFQNVGHQHKGNIGEALVDVHITNRFESDKDPFPPLFEGEFHPARRKEGVRSAGFYMEEIGEDAFEGMSWLPDLRYAINKPDEHGSQDLLVEVKTGEYAEFERNQKRVMGMLNASAEYAVLIASVYFQRDPIAEIRYATLEPDSNSNSQYRKRELNRVSD